MGPQRQKELSACQVPQLAPRTQRGANHVCHAQNRQNGKVHDRPGDIRTVSSLSVPRPGSPRDQ